MFNEIQNRPRLLNFRAQPAPEMPAKEQTMAAPDEPVVFREPGQYPDLRPEYENITNPHAWHEQIVNEKLADSKAQIDQRRSQSIYNIQNEYGSEPARSNSEPSQLPSNVYNRNVKFR